MDNSLTLILLSVGLVAAILLSFALRRFRLWRAGWQRLVLLLLCLAGWFLVLMASEEVARGLAKQSWTQTEGVVIRSEVIGEGAFRPNIVYQYPVDGQLLTASSSLSPASFGGRNARRQAAKTIVSNYPAGDSLTVYFDPTKPSESVLSRHLFWAVYLKLSFGLLLWIAGLTFLLAGFLPLSTVSRPGSTNVNLL